MTRAQVAEADLVEELLQVRRQLRSLENALDTRDVIGMAKGILIARERCSPQEAFQILSRASQRENRKVVDIAEWLVKQASIGSQRRTDER